MFYCNACSTCASSTLSLHDALPICTARFVFPDPQKKERNRGGGDQQLGSAGDFGFRLPPKKLGRQKEGKDSPNRKRGERNQKVAVPGGSRPVDSILQFRDEGSGGKEEGCALDGLGQIGKRNRGTG